jgi:hypothetical protein
MSRPTIRALQMRQKHTEYCRASVSDAILIPLRFTETPYNSLLVPKLCLGPQLSRQLCCSNSRIARLVGTPRGGVRERSSSCHPFRTAQRAVPTIERRRARSTFRVPLLPRSQTLFGNAIVPQLGCSNSRIARRLVGTPRGGVRERSDSAARCPYHRATERSIHLRVPLLPRSQTLFGNAIVPQLGCSNSRIARRPVGTPRGGVREWSFSCHPFRTA